MGACGVAARARGGKEQRDMCVTLDFDRAHPRAGAGAIRRSLRHAVFCVSNRDVCWCAGLAWLPGAHRSQAAVAAGGSGGTTRTTPQG
ncbi:MAG: hypothetical protein ACPIOQ_48730 [Promethearchaeia archaeon]